MVVALDSLRKLFPSGDAWKWLQGGSMEKILEGVGEFLQDAADDAKAEADQCNPLQTTDFERHEQALFLHPSPGLTTDERRARIVSAWKDWGNISPADLQLFLQAQGFPLYVWEWWTFVSPPAVSGPEALFEPTGNGYVLRNGLTTQAPLELSQCGMNTAQCGLESASCLYHDSLATFREVVLLSDCAEPQPENPAAVYYPGLFILCGSTFGDFVDIPAERQLELEDLILKRRRCSQKVGLLVNYV
jgi:hypothetical protein